MSPLFLLRWGLFLGWRRRAQCCCGWERIQSRGRLQREFGFFPSDGAFYVDGLMKLLFLCFVSGLGVDGGVVGGFGSAGNASFFSNWGGNSTRIVSWRRLLGGGSAATLE